MAKKKQKKTCDACGGTGLISFFQGVSRFLLSTEECPVCAGTGFQLKADEDQPETTDTSPPKKNKM